jgi:hypothetical protein
VEGNERLTAGTAVVLLVLLAVEGVTILAIRPLVSVHVFVGMLLIPPVALKLASTGWRFLRYYQRRRPYVEKGPPHPLMRFLVAPVLVASTLGIFGTGVAMFVVGRRGMVVGLHKASFVVWFGAMTVHVLVYAFRLPRLLRLERSARGRSGGGLLRGGTIAGALAVGAVLAATTLPLARPWLHRFGGREGRDRSARDVRRLAAAAPASAPVVTRVAGRTAARSPAARALGLPAVSAGPVPGYVLIADRDANKLLIVSPAKQIVWQFPRPGDLRSGQSFFNPDDAFFTPGFRRIVTNEEFNDTIGQIDLRSHRLVWSYGRPGVAGSASGELSNPDDAYVWPNRTLTVADIKNCRVLRLSPSGRIVGEIGRAGACTHDPPRALSSPNGATPLPDGGMLVTEIGGWVDRLDARGRLVFSVRTPTSYPSDAQLLPDGNVLVAGFDTPGRVDEITPQGRIVWTYGPSSGPGALDRPSLAVRWPNGMIAITDDWHHRIVVVDPRTKRIVWEYGHDGVASAAAGYLSKPDGLDLLPAAIRPAVAPRTRTPMRTPEATVVGRLPAPVSRLAAVALPDGRILAAGGLVSGASSDRVLLGPPSRLRPAGRLPAPTHDAALGLSGSDPYLFGGGEATSTDAIVHVDPGSGASRRSGSLGEPLSDLGAAAIAGRVYLVGGYTGTRIASAVLRFRPGAAPAVVARLPAGLRYAGTAALAGRVYVAGGVSAAGESASVLAVDPQRHTVRVVATLPAPVAHAPLVALGGRLYLVGGTDDRGRPTGRILGIDPASGRVDVAGRLPEPLADSAAVAVGGRVILLGGQGVTASSAVLAFRP